MYVRILFIVYTRNIQPSPSVIESLPLINPLDLGFSSGGKPPLTSDSGHGLYYRYSYSTASKTVSHLLILHLLVKYTSDRAACLHGNSNV